MSEYVRTIVCFVVFMTLVQMIMPSESMGKYVGFVLSLIMIAVMAKPALNLLSIKPDIEMEEAVYTAQYDYSGEYEKVVSDNFCRQMEDYIKNNVEGIEDIYVYAMYDLESESVNIEYMKVKTKNESLSDDIKYEISQLCGIEKEKINIHTEE